MKEFDLVRLTTNKYKNLGLPKGEVGSIVDILTVPRLGYMVEFHEISSANFEKVKTVESYEIELIRNESNE